MKEEKSMDKKSAKQKAAGKHRTYECMSCGAQQSVKFFQLRMKNRAARRGLAVAKVPQKEDKICNSCFSQRVATVSSQLDVITEDFSPLEFVDLMTTYDDDLTVKLEQEAWGLLSHTNAAIAERLLVARGILQALDETQESAAGDVDVIASPSESYSLKMHTVTISRGGAAHGATGRAGRIAYVSNSSGEDRRRRHQNTLLQILQCLPSVLIDLVVLYMLAPGRVADVLDLTSFRIRNRRSCIVKVPWFHAWVEDHPNGHDYFLCADYSHRGLCILMELDSQVVMTVPLGEYMWSSIQPSPDGTKLAIKALRRSRNGKRFVVLVVDFSDPMRCLRSLLTGHDQVAVDNFKAQSSNDAAIARLKTIKTGEQASQGHTAQADLLQLAYERHEAGVRWEPFPLLHAFQCGPGRITKMQWTISPTKPDTCVLRVPHAVPSQWSTALHPSAFDVAAATAKKYPEDIVEAKGALVFVRGKLTSAKHPPEWQVSFDHQNGGYWCLAKFASLLIERLKHPKVLDEADAKCE